MCAAKHGGGRMLIWACFAATDPKILYRLKHKTVWRLKLRPNWVVMQQNDDPKQAVTGNLQQNQKKKKKENNEGPVKV